MSETTVSKKRKDLIAKSIKTLTQIVAADNIAFIGEGKSLWKLDSTRKFSFVCTVGTSKGGNARLIPVMDGVKKKDGTQASAFHIYAGALYSEIETFDENEEILVEVVTRIPNPDITDADLDRIDAWARATNEKEGKAEQTPPSVNFKIAREKDHVTYMLTKVSELPE